MSLFSWVQDQIKQAYAALADTYDKHLMEHLLEPENIVAAELSIEMDDGSTNTYQARRSQHCNVRWPYKGGIRFHQDVSLDEVKSLSAWMSFKCAAVDIPLWWGKGGIIVDPKQLSQAELEKLSRAYIDAIWEAIWPTKDIPAPDVNTNSTIMWWMADQYAKNIGERQPGVITGKPLTIWGSAGRGIATALGGLYVLMRYLEQHNDSLKGKKIVIQWAGNAWLTFAQLASDEWALIIGISDSKGGIYNPDGLDISTLKELKNNKKSVIEYPAATALPNQDVLDNDCDILVPAALENQITADNADDIQANIILELANGPTTAEADKILDNKKITVIPDILANAGWVTVSYFEQVQNNTNYYWSEEEVFEKLNKIMVDATDAILHTASIHTTSLRDAAYIVALDRILAAMQARGW